MRFWFQISNPFKREYYIKLIILPITGHPGKENTFALLAKDFYLPYYLRKITAALYPKLQNIGPFVSIAGVEGKAFLNLLFILQRV